MATEVNMDDILNLKLDDLLSAKPVEAFKPKDKVEIKRYGITVDMVDSVEIAKHNHSAAAGYEIFLFHGESKSRVSSDAVSTIPGNRMRRVK